MKCLGNGRLEIRGRFPRNSDACFRLVLSSQVTDDDIFNRYILSGDLELGDNEESLQLSHLAVVKIEQEQTENQSRWKNYYHHLRKLWSKSWLE